jgi:uncharacterized membrane protein
VRTPNASSQVLAAVVVGIVATVAVGLVYRWPVASLVGYDVAVLTYIGRVWTYVWPLDAEQVAARAVREDPTRTLTSIVLLAAAVLSLGAVAAVIVVSRDHHGAIRALDVGAGLATVAVSWLLIQTIFALTYARIYYGDVEGGVSFQKDVRPVYADFAYLAFTVGMTFQISDTDLQSTEFRRAVLRHALLSYLFGAVILAATINLVASLAA